MISESELKKVQFNNIQSTIFMFHLSYIIWASKIIANTSKLLSPLLWLANKTQTSLHNRISFQFPLPVNVCPRSLPWNKFPIISRAVQNNFSSLLPPWAVAVPFVNNGNNGRDVFLGLESEDGRGKGAFFSNLFREQWVTSDFVFFAICFSVV